MLQRPGLRGCTITVGHRWLCAPLCDPGTCNSQHAVLGSMRVLSSQLQFIILAHLLLIKKKKILFFLWSLLISLPPSSPRWVSSSCSASSSVGRGKLPSRCAASFLPGPSQAAAGACSPCLQELIVSSLWQSWPGPRNPAGCRRLPGASHHVSSVNRPERSARRVGGSLVGQSSAAASRPCGSAGQCRGYCRSPELLL